MCIQFSVELDDYDRREHERRNRLALPRMRQGSSDVRSSNNGRIGNHTGFLYPLRHESPMGSQTESESETDRSKP